MNKRNKLLMIILAVVLITSSIAVIVKADEPVYVLLTASDTDLEIGETFSLGITLDPNNENITAWMIHQLDYKPAGLIEIKSITIGADWDTNFYDLGSYDNSIGELIMVQAFSTISTNDTTKLLTIDFEAKNSGTAIISIPQFQIQNNKVENLNSSINTVEIIVQEEEEEPPNGGGGGGSGGGGSGGGGSGGGGGNPFPPPVNNPPISNPGGPYNASLNVSIILNGTKSWDDKGIVQWFWNFGDGQGINCTCPTINHTYTDYGKHVITLVVKDEEGLTDVNTTTIFIEVPYDPDADNETEDPNDTNDTNGNDTNETEPPDDNKTIPSSKDKIEVPSYTILLIAVLFGLLFLTYWFVWRKEND